MLIEIKMTDGEKLRMEADRYEYENSNLKRIIVTKDNNNTFFNSDYAVYIGRVDRIYGGGEDD